MLAILQRYPTLQEHQRTGVAFILAKCLSAGRVEAYSAGIEDAQPLAKTSVLEACCSQPRDAAMGRMIVDMAIATAGHRPQGAWLRPRTVKQAPGRSTCTTRPALESRSATPTRGCSGKRRWPWATAKQSTTFAMSASCSQRPQSRLLCARPAPGRMAMSPSKHDIGVAVDQLAQIWPTTTTTTRQKKRRRTLLHVPQSMGMRQCSQPLSPYCSSIPTKRQKLRRRLAALSSGADKRLSSTAYRMCAAEDGRFQFYSPAKNL